MASSVLFNFIVLKLVVQLFWNSALVRPPQFEGPRNRSSNNMPKVMTAFLLRSCLTRGELYAGVFIIGCVNGLAAKAISSVHRIGWQDAVLGTFDVSAVVIAACLAGISLVLSDRTEFVRAVDVTLAAFLLLVIALPMGAASWIAVAMLSLYVLSTQQGPQSLHRGAVILLATTVPMLWSRLVFDLFAKYVLAIDALLVGWVLGTHRHANMVEFADHSGTLAIFPSCSSLANASLGVLCWITISEMAGHKRQPQDVLWCMLVCACVVAVNVLRMSLMGLSYAHYAMLHSPLSELVVNVIILVLVAAISMLGVRRDIFSHA